MSITDHSARSPSASSEARLFIALWPPDAVRDAVSRHAERWSWPRAAARVRSERLHMTLHFLGRVPRVRMAEVVEGLTVPFEPFELRLDHGELWSGGIAVLAAAEVPASLAALHGSLQRALERLDVPSVRSSLRPHVTLARRARGAVPPAECEEIVWAVDGYALVESVLGPRSQYRVAAQWG